MKVYTSQCNSRYFLTSSFRGKHQIVQGQYLPYFLEITQSDLSLFSQTNNSAKV